MEVEGATREVTTEASMPALARERERGKEGEKEGGRRDVCEEER